MHHKGHREHKEETISREVIGCAIEVHKALGPGLLQSTYQKCMEIELIERGISFIPKSPLAVTFKNHQIDDAYRIDLLVEHELIVELRACRNWSPSTTRSR